MILLVFLARTVCDVTWSNNGSNKITNYFPHLLKNIFFSFSFLTIFIAILYFDKYNIINFLCLCLQVKYMTDCI